jgi:hypothetical protein
MGQMGKFLLSVFGGIAGFTVGLNAAVAQEVPTPGGYQFFVTPYLWLSGIYGTVQTPIARESTVNVNVGPGQVLGDLTGAPFMGSAEVRFGPIGLLGDMLHMVLGTNISTRNVFYQGGHLGLTANTGTALALYRFVDTPNQFADLGAGFRSWGFGASVSLNPGLLAGASTNRSAGWGDPLIAGRYHFSFDNGIGLTAYGDVGGFDLGAHTDWQVMGTIDYALNSWIDLHLGYRSLNFDFTNSTGAVGFDIHLRGPIFAGTFRF